MPFWISNHKQNKKPYARPEYSYFSCQCRNKLLSQQLRPGELPENLKIIEQEKKDQELLKKECECSDSNLPNLYELPDDVNQLDQLESYEEIAWNGFSRLMSASDI